MTHLACFTWRFSEASSIAGSTCTRRILAHAALKHYICIVLVASIASSILLHLVLRRGPACCVEAPHLALEPRAAQQGSRELRDAGARRQAPTARAENRRTGSLSARASRPKPEHTTERQIFCGECYGRLTASGGLTRRPRPPGSQRRRARQPRPSSPCAAAPDDGWLATHLTDVTTVEMPLTQRRCSS